MIIVGGILLVLVVMIAINFNIDVKKAIKRFDTYQKNQNQLKLHMEK